MIPTPSALLAAERIALLDHHFALFAARLGGDALAPDDRAALGAAAALVSAHSSQGHVCLPLPELAGQPVLEEAAEQDALGCWPPLAEWVASLRRSAVVGDGSVLSPLVLDAAGRLYLHRYWEHEQCLARLLAARIAEPPTPVDPAWLHEAVYRLFPADGGEVPVWHHLAAFVVATRRLAVISGGPGTGKTTAVIRLLALLIEQAQGQGRPLRIALVAPTGKAAARLQETVDLQRAHLRTSDAVRAALPHDATTLHRRLGAFGTGFTYGPGNRIPYDVVVVDEASMVDVMLMSRLVSALEDGARLVLLGDRDQLASVQAGAVLGDLCRVTKERGYSRDLQEPFALATGSRLPADEVHEGGAGLGDVVVQLRRNYRFSAASGIGAVAVSTVDGRADAVIAALGDRLLAPEPGRVARAAVEGYTPYLRAPDVATAFQRFLGFRVLCAHRRGDAGVEKLNPAIEARLAREGLVPPDAEWYPGRPVMVTRNDHALRLYNGDVGLAWHDPEGVLLVHFPDGKGGFRTLLPTRLPPHETVYAMTVHKSQGSEFGRVLLVLPEEVSPVLTRELIYTGVTRAKDEVTVVGTAAVLREAVRARVVRSSGLVDALSDPAPA